ncbi:serine/threonine-protein kinase [Streptomyces sp. GbtcB6]|uniref:serine/threonine-protein kinase n=1 Tax=Streptomyces sp. GbtcB6 TaxID=2824751 RepID=UPI001C30D133|nr:serine/threonine-protein kinase [Streptomyces sp. GbtcB6]
MTGRYRLAESIGQGGMGRVWRAADETLDRQVAVKEMRIDGLDAEDARTRRERTLREARATARIDHPNVVRVYDVVDEGERLWIVMELVNGRSLEWIMAEEGALSPRAAARIGLGLVAALRQVHAGGVLHRDIKPGNVLVESTAGRVVLTDFGIAAIQDAKALTMVGMLVGSPDYMAPERISGRPQGPPSDLWSLGATLCAALDGRSPFSRDTTLATLHAVLYEEPELPSTAGPLHDLLAALLEKEPTVRPGLEEVERELHPVAYPAQTPTERYPAPRPAERPTPAYVVHLPAPEDERPQPPPPVSASTETPSEPRAEVRSETPSSNSTGPTLERPDSERPARERPELQRPVRGAGNCATSHDEPARTHRGKATRRTTLLAVLGTAAVATALAILLTTTTGGGEGKSATGNSSTPSTSTPTSSAPTVEGTARPRSLPPGAHEEAGGFAWAPPTGWRRDVKTGAEVHYTSPDGSQELVAKSSLARGNLMDTWTASERSAHQGQDYTKIRLAETTFRGYPAVVWEYTFTLRGTPWHARLLGFDADGKSYQINTWYQPAVEAQAVRTYEQVKESFTLL